MPRCLTILTGPACCGKTARLLAGYAEVLRAGPPGAGLWLAPNWRAAAEVRQRLLEHLPDGCFAPGVMTFATAAENILQFAREAIRPLTRLAKRHLVRRLLAEQDRAGRLKHFGPIADRAGLVDQLCEFLSELKRLEIWPEEFLGACQRRGITEKDAELAELYEAYQQSLREHHLYDAEGRFWSARALLKAGQRRPFERLRLVVADGFTDFTRTQHEILEILAGRVEQMIVALALEDEPRREDLFAKPAATVRELRRRHARVKVETLPRPEKPDWPAMDRLERRLFRNPREVAVEEPDAERDSPIFSPLRSEKIGTVPCEVLAASRELGEVEAVASRVKRLLSEGDARLGGRPVRPDEIAVVSRDPQDAGSLVAEVFLRLGVPHSLESGQTLDQAAAVKALVSLVRIDVEDWPLRALLALLSSNYFRPDWPEWCEGRASLAATGSLRQLQIPRGREAMLEGLGGGEGLRGPEGGATKEGHGPGAHATGAALLGRLAEAFDRLPRRATLADWADHWMRLAADTGLSAAMADPVGEEAIAAGGLSDRAAFGRLVEALKTADRLADWTGQAPAELDRAEALAALSDIVASERVGPSGDESGRVRVLSAPSVRGLHVPYVFLMGLSEKAFPRPDREDRFYNDAEYLRLIDEGLPLVARGERNREEMLLFYEAATRATRRLVLSYPAYNEAAQPLSPSPYLQAAEEACGPVWIERTDLTDLSPIPSTDDPLSPAEFRVKAMAEALEGDVSLLAGLLGNEGVGRSGTPSYCGVGRNLLAGLETTRQRSDPERFGPSEGMLGAAAEARLLELFSAERTYSPTALEDYATCPFRFFMERVLRVEPLEDLALAVDFMRRGRIAHDLMARLHEAVNRQLGRPGSPLSLDAEDYQRTLDAAVEEGLPRPSDGGVLAALAEVDRRLMRRWLADYRRQHEKYDRLLEDCSAPPAPQLFEASFGRPGRGGRPSTEEPFVLKMGGESIRIEGRVDRIDVGRVGDTDVFTVIDYKTGSPLKFNEETIRAGTTLQLPLYAMAVGEVLLADHNPVPWMVGYWYLRDRGFKRDKCGQLYEPGEQSVRPTESWEAIRSELPQIVTRLIGGIRRGEFPMTNQDERCTTFCPFATLCRIGQVRALEKDKVGRSGIPSKK